MDTIGFMADPLALPLRQFQGACGRPVQPPKGLAAVHNMRQDPVLPTIPDAHGPSCRPDPSHLLSV